MKDGIWMNISLSLIAGIVSTNASAAMGQQEGIVKDLEIATLCGVLTPAS